MSFQLVNKNKVKENQCMCEACFPSQRLIVSLNPGRSLKAGGKWIVEMCSCWNSHQCSSNRVDFTEMHVTLWMPTLLFPKRWLIEAYENGHAWFLTWKSGLSVDWMRPGAEWFHKDSSPAFEKKKICGPPWWSQEQASLLLCDGILFTIDSNYLLTRVLV